jgi:hypothetical protein
MNRGRRGKAARSGTAILALLGVLTSSESAYADGGDLRSDPLADVIAYARLIDEYEHGDDIRAIAAITAWKADALAAVIDAVEKARTAGSEAIVEVEVLLVKFPVAVMLHTEAGLLLNWRGDPTGSSTQ